MLALVSTLAGGAEGCTSCARGAAGQLDSGGNATEAALIATAVVLRDALEVVMWADAA